MCVCVLILTQTTVPIMHHEVGSQSARSEVVHAAGPICHISHHQSVRLCESDKQHNQPINDFDHHPIAIQIFQASSKMTGPHIWQINHSQAEMSLRHPCLQLSGLLLAVN